MLGQEKCERNQNTENNQLEKSETNCDYRMVDETTQEAVPI